jgi:lambda family phage portal protein
MIATLDHVQRNGNGTRPPVQLALLDAAGRPIVRPPMAERDLVQRRRRITMAAYRAAETNRTNVRHWQPADGTDLSTALESELDTIRNRARYERRNDGTCAGLVQTFADDIVGDNGPTLQIVVGDADLAAAELIERAWEYWSERCDRSSADHLGDLLRVLVKHWIWAGDFAIRLVTDDGDPAGRVPDDPGAGVQLAIVPVSPARIATPLGQTGTGNVLAGVMVDRYDRPVGYYVTKSDPGRFMMSTANETEFVPAADLWLIFEREEIGQVRGEPKIAPVLELFGHLRNYIDDTLLAARMAAMLAGYMVTGNSATSVDTLNGELPIFEIEPGTLSALPSGWDMRQTTPQHPGTTFRDFIDELQSEVGRPTASPKSRAKMTAERANYSSARLDMHLYWGGVRAKRRFLERRLLNPLLRAWLREFVLVSGVRFPPNWRAVWRWSGAPVIDEIKHATAIEIGLRSGELSHRDVQGDRGRDWREHLEQRVREAAYLRDLAQRAGVDLAGFTNGQAAPARPARDPDDQGADDPQGGDADR